MSTALLKAIKIAGSRRALARAIGATPDAINGWLNRGVHIPLQYAIEIDRFTLGIVTWTALTPHLAYFAKRWADFLIINHSCRLQSIPIVLSSIKRQCSSNVGSPAFLVLAADIKENGLKRPICVSSENALIFGAKRLQVFEALDKKTIPAWRISLTDLMCGNYSEAQLYDIFSVSERVAISLALEKQLGNRQGFRKNNPSRENFPELTGRTDEHIAKILNFGNHKTYQHAKKVYQCGCYELIAATDEQRIAISSAALLAKLPQNEQQQILSGSCKDIASHINQLRSRRQAHHSITKEA